ncbi:MAG: hypothetical protein LUF68_04145 [Clostridiales bacterium]|nr:hypothetical protein [Clostridiales bacterium]
MELITNDGMPYLKVPELSEEEKKLPSSRFYTDYKLYPPGPLQQQILSAGPIPVEDAIPIEHWLDHLQIHGYPKAVYGYTMMPGGYGFYIEYSVSPVTWQGKWRRWYGKWYNQHSKNMPEGRGNLRYKIWNPVDHWDHNFVNGVDDKDGVWSMETLDLGATGDPSKGIGAVSHNIDLRDYGLSEERYDALVAADCRPDACWEEFENSPGHHLVLRFSRPCPLGGRESINCEWMGFYAKDGKIVRDEATPVDETYLRNVITHNTIERQHLYQVLPDLYEAYQGLPMDAD